MSGLILCVWSWEILKNMCIVRRRKMGLTFILLLDPDPQHAVYCRQFGRLVLEVPQLSHGERLITHQQVPAQHHVGLEQK